MRWVKPVVGVAVVGLLASGVWLGKGEVDRRADRRAARRAVAEREAQQHVARLERELAAARVAAESEAAAAYAPVVYEQLSWAVGVAYPEARWKNLRYGQYLYNITRAIAVLKARRAPTPMAGEVADLVQNLEKVLRAHDRAYRAEMAGDMAARDAARFDVRAAHASLALDLRSVEHYSEVPMPAPLRKWVG